MTNYFNAYQLKAGQTAIFPWAGDVESMTGLSYVAMGLAGEAGEIVGKVKKILLDSGGLITDEHRDALSAALGDVLRYAALLATQLDIGLAMVANQGLAKLASRTT
jgi:NTP pyrophosphatase (non-canonical NTP hydrolase)